MAEGLVLPYLDIPFQHASPKVLKAMKRPANEAKVLERLAELARHLPRHRHPLQLRRRLPRRDRGGFPISARLARGSPARPRRRLPLRAGRGRRRQRPARPGARRGQGRALRPHHGAHRAHLSAAKLAAKVGRTLDVIDRRRSMPKTAAPPAAPRPTRPKSTAKSTCATPAGSSPGDIVARRRSRTPTSTTCSACQLNFDIAASLIFTEPARLS